MKTKNNFIMNELNRVSDIIDSYEVPKNMSAYQVLKCLTTYYFLEDIDNISPIRELYRRNEQIKKNNKEKNKNNRKKLLKIHDDRKQVLIDSVCSTMKKFNFSIKEYEEYRFIPKIEKLYNTFLKATYDVTLRDFDVINIYQSELDTINTYVDENKTKQKKMRKLLFTLYVMAKFELRKGWINTSSSDLFKLANVTATSVEKEIMIGELIKRDFVKDLKKIDNLAIGISLSENHINDQVVIKIDDISNLGNKYFAYMNKDYIVCKSCGKLVKIKSKNDGSTKYCQRCAEKIEANNALLRKRKQRAMNK